MSCTYVDTEEGYTIIRVTRRNGDVHDVLVDDTDIHLFEGVTVFVVNDRGGAMFARTSFGCAGVSFQDQVHRYLLRPPDGFAVDHINGNGLDNRRSNLRLTTIKQNAENRRGANKNSTSGIRGVYYETSSDSWVAQCCHNKRNYKIGRFKRIEDAEVAVKAFRAKHHTFSADYRELQQAA